MASVSTMGPWMKGPCEHGKELTWISSLEKSWRRSPKCNLEEQVTVFQMSSHKDHFRWKGQHIRSRILKLWTHWRIIQRSTWWECSVFIMGHDWKETQRGGWKSGHVKHVSEAGLYPVGSISQLSSYTMRVPKLVFRKSFKTFFL